MYVHSNARHIRKSSKTEPTIKLELETDAEYLKRLERIALEGDFGRCEECGRVYALPLNSEYGTCEGCTPRAEERAEAEERHSAEMWAEGHACPVDRDFFRKLMPE